MSFAKGLLIGLVLFIGINILMSIVLVLVSGLGFDIIIAAFTSISGIGGLLFSSMAITPGTALFTILMSFLGGSFSLSLLLTGLAYFVAPLVASLVAGKMTESKGQALGAWFLVCIISAVVLWLLYFLGGAISMLSAVLMSLGVSISGEFFVLIFLIIIAVVNGIFYGCFAMLTSSEEW